MSMLLSASPLFGAYAAYVWSSYAVALGALAVLWVVSLKRRRTLKKTLALLEAPSAKTGKMK
jgi:heme exporter protein CcmD